jgi:hypothetical protein
LGRRLPPALALCGLFLLRRGLRALGAVSTLALPGGRSSQPLEQVEACGLELVANHPEREEPDPHVVLRSRLVVLASAARRGLRGERLGGERQGELYVGLDLARVQRPVEESKLDRAAKKQAVEVDSVVAVMSRAT